MKMQANGEMKLEVYVIPPFKGAFLFKSKHIIYDFKAAIDSKI